jgi:hypothetical protein
MLCLVSGIPECLLQYMYIKCLRPLSVKILHKIATSRIKLGKMCPVFPPKSHRLSPLVLFPLPTHGSVDWQHCHPHGLSISLQASPVGLLRPRLSVHPRTRGQIQPVKWSHSTHEYVCRYTVKKGQRFSLPQPGCH